MMLSNHIVVGPRSTHPRMEPAPLPESSAVAAQVLTPGLFSQAMLSPQGVLVGFIFRQQLDIEARLVVQREGWDWSEDLAKRWGVVSVYGTKKWLRQMRAFGKQCPSGGRAILFP